MKSGYLIPADSQGQVLKVSPTLANSTRRIGRELRRKRLRARKLDDNDLETVQRKTRRNSFSRYTKKSREESTDSAVSRRNVQKSKRKRNVARLPKSDKDKPGRRPRKETRFVPDQIILRSYPLRTVSSSSITSRFVFVTLKDGKNRETSREILEGVLEGTSDDFEISLERERSKRSRS